MSAQFPDLASPPLSYVVAGLQTGSWVSIAFSPRRRVVSTMSPAAKVLSIQFQVVSSIRTETQHPPSHHEGVEPEVGFALFVRATSLGPGRPITLLF